MAHFWTENVHSALADRLAEAAYMDILGLSYVCAFSAEWNTADHAKKELKALMLLFSRKRFVIDDLLQRLISCRRRAAYTYI